MGKQVAGAESVAAMLTDYNRLRRSYCRVAKKHGGHPTLTPDYAVEMYSPEETDVRRVAASEPPPKPRTGLAPGHSPRSARPMPDAGDSCERGATTTVTGKMSRRRRSVLPRYLEQAAYASSSQSGLQEQ